MKQLYTKTNFLGDSALSLYVQIVIIRMMDIQNLTILKEAVQHEPVGSEDFYIRTNNLAQLEWFRQELVRKFCAMERLPDMFSLKAYLDAHAYT